MSWTRRELVFAGLGLALGGSGLLASTGCSETDACVDADALTTGQASLRASFHYVGRSPDGEARQCAGCQFFSPGDAADAAGCGTCSILQGPVNGRGACDSWSARA